MQPYTCNTSAWLPLATGMGATAMGSATGEMRLRLGLVSGSGWRRRRR